MTDPSPAQPPVVDTKTTADSKTSDDATPTVEATPMVVRNPAESYGLFALIFAIVGVVIPVVPAAAALILVAAVEREEASPRATSMANAASTVAYLALAFQAVVCLVLLLGVFFKVIG